MHHSALRCKLENILMLPLKTAALQHMPLLPTFCMLIVVKEHPANLQQYSIWVLGGCSMFLEHVPWLAPSARNAIYVSLHVRSCRVMLSVMPFPVPGCWGNTSCLVQLTSAAYLAGSMMSTRCLSDMLMLRFLRNVDLLSILHTLLYIHCYLLYVVPYYVHGGRRR